MLTDHLHVRGEHALRGCRRTAPPGPPPRAWRARGGQGRCRVEHRTTSTCVESTGRARPVSSGTSDHLHVRGEHAGGRACAGDPAERTTSTCVESTPGRRGAPRGLADHLHVRGEHVVLAARRQARDGPPPRAWRALLPNLESGIRGRTTSTCVESTATTQMTAPCGSDHLHVRGEHVTRTPSASNNVGPPPRAWRARGAGAPGRAGARTTSTCVESTAARSAAAAT